jgi:molybdenum cofactor cytidylyltransferase
MQFQALPIDDAKGAILAHAVRAGGRLFKKGRVLGTADIDALRVGGITEVMAVRLEAGDVPEDEAAAHLAGLLTGDALRAAPAFTGRANLYAQKAGLLVIDTDRIDAVNFVHESITVATLPRYSMVSAGDMVATVKIIPFAAPREALQKADHILAAHAALSIAPFEPHDAALISTHLAGQKESLLDKNRAALEARLTPLGGRLISEHRCSHDASSIAQAIREAGASEAEFIFIFGASAITDRGDAIPAGILEAGGQVLHFGMPVDPGNLLLLGRWRDRPVIGLPGCARSPKFNGFDIVLRRLSAGISIGPNDLMRIGVGGLLAEIVTRPQPREGAPQPIGKRAPRLAAVILAAGQSSRMGHNKLLAHWRGKPLLRHVAEAALASTARPVIAVTGHEASATRNALSGLDVVLTANPHYAEGLSTSLRTGLASVPADCGGALILLGDMPEVGTDLIERMIAGFAPEDGRAICIAVRGGKRGNPVLWARRFFPEMETLTGDSGAKHLLGIYDEQVCEVEAGDDSVLTDIDTPEALAALLEREHP